ncbi:unnamed protein product [Adineta ricciae]|uniref:MULE transposase domain-containing protein n=1 Tax=Adineta ricciae TaxID=249248 RepID=A0A816B1U4_ADIRI|nr:unnamed protein product [Adineta ricciae]
MSSSANSPPSPELSLDRPCVSFVTPNKGKQLLSLGYYLFKCNKATSSKRYWICMENGCGVFVHTDLNNKFLSITGGHNHVARPNIIEMKAPKEKMKPRILNETTSITKIYDEEIAPAGVAESVAAQFLTVIKYLSSMSKTPRKKHHTTIFMNEAFGAAPGAFEQVFLIHVSHFGQRLSVAFCLMANRRASTCTELFQRLKHVAKASGTQFAPTNIVSDFDAALVPVVRQEFPDAKHSGRLFYFIQTVHRKMMCLGLNDEYAQCQETHEQCKQLIALSLMPLQEAERQFKCFRNIASESVEDLFTYFERQWISEKVPLTMWNFHELDHRTNDILAGNQIIQFKMKLVIVDLAHVF